MKILIIDPHGLASEALRNGTPGNDNVLQSHGILETVWMLGVETPQIVIVIQPDGPDVDWVKLSHNTCPSARVVSLPVPEASDSVSHRLQEFWTQLPHPQAYANA